MEVDQNLPEQTWSVSERRRFIPGYAIPESEYGFLPGRRAIAASKPELAPLGEIRAREQPQSQDNCADNDDNGSRCTTPRNDDADESGEIFLSYWVD